MIQGPNYIYVEIPRTGSTIVADILMEQCEGFRITPRHDPIWDIKDIDRPAFTVVRSPYTRLPSLWHYMDHDRTRGFQWWYNWVKDRDTGIYIDKPQWFWAENTQKQIKLEELEDKFPKLMKAFGYKIEMPEIKQTEYNLKKGDYEFIFKEFSQDFARFGYSKDRRKEY